MHAHHGNPSHLAGYLARMEHPSRVRWQKPEAVLSALRLKRGMVVADIGAGPGFFTRRLARRVGKTGHVFAVDVELRMLEVLLQRLERDQAGNVSPVLGSGDNPRLPRDSCHRILMVNTFHHVDGRKKFLRAVAQALRPGGLFANVDYHKQETPMGPPLSMRITPAEFSRDARAAGLVPVTELPDLLPYQYVLVFRTR